MARVSNTHSPRLSNQWIDVAEATHSHAVKHSDQVFLVLPLLLVLGIVILVMEFVHEEEGTTCPNRLSA